MLYCFVDRVGGGRFTHYPNAQHIVFQKCVLGLQSNYSAVLHYESYLIALGILSHGYLKDTL